MLGEWPVVGVAVVTCFLLVIVVCRALYALRYPVVQPATFGTVAATRAIANQECVRGCSESAVQLHRRCESVDSPPWQRYSYACFVAIGRLLFKLILLIAKAIVPAMALILLCDGVAWVVYAGPASVLFWETTHVTKPLISVVSSDTGNSVFGVFGLLESIEKTCCYDAMLDSFYSCMTQPCAASVQTSGAGGLAEQQQMAQELMECATSLQGVDLDAVCVPGSEFESDNVVALATTALALAHRGTQTPSCALKVCVYTEPMCSMETLVNNPNFNLEDMCYMSASVSFFISMTGSLITSGKPASYSGSAVTEVCSSSQEAIDAIEPYCNGKFPPAATASQVESAFETSYDDLNAMLPSLANIIYYTHLSMTQWWPIDNADFSWTLPSYRPNSKAYYGFGTNIVLLQDHMMQLKDMCDTMLVGKMLQIIGSLFALYSINVSAGLVRERMMDLAQVGK